MLHQVRKSKLYVAWMYIFFFIAVVLSQTPSAGAQDLFSDPTRRQPFDGRGSDILGTVFLNRAGQPASKIVVKVRSLNSGIFQNVLTDFGGHFELRGVPPGPYQITVDEQGYREESVIVNVNSFASEISLCLKPTSASPASASDYTVSVRELKIPAKAQDEFNRGLERLAKGDAAGSLSHFNKATAAFPQYYEAFYQIAIAEGRLKHGESAMEAFQKSIDLSGGRYARAQFAYGLVLCQQKKPEEAERIIRTGLETDANSAEGHLFLAVALLDQNHVDEAEKSAREALLRNPQYADVYLVLADIQGIRKDYRSQLADLDTYLKLAPPTPANEPVRQARDAVKRLVADSSPQD